MSLLLLFNPGSGHAPTPPTTTGTPIGLLLGLTKNVPYTTVGQGTPIGLLLALTQIIPATGPVPPTVPPDTGGGTSSGRGGRGSKPGAERRRRRRPEDIIRELVLAHAETAVRPPAAPLQRLPELVPAEALDRFFGLLRPSLPSYGPAQDRQTIGELLGLPDERTLADILGLSPPMMDLQRSNQVMFALLLLDLPVDEAEKLRRDNLRMFALMLS